MLVGLIWGIVIPVTPFPRLALTAHIQLTIAKGSVSARILIAGPRLTWLVMFSEIANAWWGTIKMLPIAAEQGGATGAFPWQENIVTVAHLIGAVVLIAYWGVILCGLFHKPAETTTVKHGDFQ
jgi:hydroxylaminobenzene mutase